MCSIFIASITRIGAPFSIVTPGFAEQCDDFPGHGRSEPPRMIFSRGIRPQRIDARQRPPATFEKDVQMLAASNDRGPNAAVTELDLQFAAIIERAANGHAPPIERDLEALQVASTRSSCMTEPDRKWILP